MSADWFVTRDGTKTAGPLSAQQLEQLYATGRLRPNDLVRQGLEAEWQPAHQVKERFRSGGSVAVQESPPAPTPPPPPAPVAVEPAPAVRPVPSVARAPGARWLIGSIAVGSLLLMLGVVGAAVAFWLVSKRDAAQVAERPESTPPVTSPVVPPPPPNLRPPSPTPPPAAPPPAVWTGHTAAIRSVAFSTDGLRALSGSGGFETRNGQMVLSEDNAVRLWNARTGQQIKVLKGFKDGISSVAFSPDGRYAVLCSCGRWKGDTYIDGTDFGIRLWDVETEQELSKVVGPAEPTTEDASKSNARFQGHTYEVFSVTFSPDGKQVLSGARDSTIRLWDVATGRELKKLVGHSSSVYQVKFSPDGRRALSCSADLTVRLWDLETGLELHRMTGHQDLIWSVALSPDGKLAASAGGSQHVGGKIVRGAGDYEIRLWDLETGKELRRFTGHKATVGSVAFTPDGRRLLSGGCSQPRDESDYSVRLWEVATGKELRRFDGHDGSVFSVAVSPDGRYALSGAWGGGLRLWDLSPRP